MDKHNESVSYVHVQVQIRLRCKNMHKEKWFNLKPMGRVVGSKCLVNYE